MTPLPPGLRRVLDASYLPALGPDNWGLFDGALAVDGANRRLAPGEPSSSWREGERAPEAEYLYIGLMTDHYGHFITDVLSRLWPMLGWAGPRPRLLYHGGAGRQPPERFDFLRRMLEGLGFGLGDLVSFDRPTRIPRVVIPAPSFVDTERVHAIFAELCRAIGRPLWNEGIVDTVERPAYLVKTGSAARFHQVRGEDILVEELDRLGVDVVSPEDLGFAEQVRLFASRRIILGGAGSALHTCLFSAPERRIVGLHWAPWVNANFLMFDELNRNRAYYYHPPVTELVPGLEVRLVWTIPEPRAVAAELVEAASAFDGLEARDLADDARREREARRLGPRLSRLRRRLGRKLGRLRRPAGP